MSDTERVLAEVHAERISQIERWGAQIIKDVADGDTGYRMFDLSYAVLARRAKNLNDALPPDQRNMLFVLLEEVFEAAEARAAGDVAAYRAELVQVAALAVKAIELVDMRTATCICTHPRYRHNAHGLCTAVPGVLGCGCLGFLEDR